MRQIVVELPRSAGDNSHAPEGRFFIDPSGYMWIEPEDVVSAEPTTTPYYKGGMYYRVTLNFDGEAERLLAAYEQGARLCYDGDPTCSLCSENNTLAEIFWAVQYRGGLDVAHKIDPNAPKIKTIDDLQNAERCTQDGYVCHHDYYVNDGGTPAYAPHYSLTSCPSCGNGCVYQLVPGSWHGTCLKCEATLAWNIKEKKWKESNNMSAFVLEPESICRMAEYLARDKDSPLTHGALYKLMNPHYRLSEPGEVERLARNMHIMNVEAIHQRYGDPHSAYSFTFSEQLCPSHIQMLKSLHCYLYQCSEGNVSEWVLYKLLEKVADKLAAAIIRHIPEYQEAEWG